MRKPWTLWAALVAISYLATIDLFAWSQDQRVLASAGGLLLVITTVLVFRAPVVPSPFVNSYQRTLFGCVILFAGWVAFWGLLLPARIANALPFTVPPLHAQFLGAMYLSGAVGLTMNLCARDWREIRVTTAMLAIWTGMLGLVSLFQFGAFDWSRPQTWFWFFAYICFPLVATWITWCQRADQSSNCPSTAAPSTSSGASAQGDTGGAPALRASAQGDTDGVPPDTDGAPPLSPGLRNYMNAQGSVATLLALGLLVAPSFMTTIWPWAITPLLAQLYSAPFLAYGIGSLYAARQRTWGEVRIVVTTVLVFALGVLVASSLHANLFNPHGLAAWLWFGGFFFVSVTSLLLWLNRLSSR
jgi:hypothetical protein